VDANHTVIRAWIDEAAARRGDDIYLADARGAASISYADLLDVARDTERRLDDAGLPRGARIQVRFASPLDYAVAMVSIIAAGRVAVPLDPGAPDADIARVLSVARPAGTLTSRFPIGAEGSADGGESTTKHSFPDVAGAAAFEPRAGKEYSPFGISVLDLDPLTTGTDGGIFLCTSGTTGTPKGILLRDEQLAHVASSVVDWHKLTQDDRGYCSLPLFHVNAEVVGVLATLRAGAYLAVDGKFSRRGFWDRMTERQITWINAVPAIISILAMDPPEEPPAGLRFVRSASAPLPLAALDRFERGLGVPVIETYGMTEAASMITANPLDGPRKPGSAGLPAGSQVRIAVPGGETAGAGDIGRVTIRGVGIITAYASGGRPGVIDADGWLDTGDLGYLDDEGYLFSWDALTT